MDVTITGAGGFLGQRLVRRLLQLGTISDSSGRVHPIGKIVACDLSLSALPADSQVERIEGDISNPLIISRIITSETRCVFHLAAVVSAAAEDDFDLGMRINFDTTRALLETCRRIAPGASFLFASSVAVYGGELPAVVDDGMALAPQTSYGAQKSMGELLINDYSRRGFVDGRCLRLPTIVVRPGRPNKAASSFASSIIREPLSGEEAVCPVPVDLKMCLLSPRKAVEAFIHAQAISADGWGSNRVVQLPALSVSIRQMLAALEEIAGPRVVQRIRFESDARIERIVSSWPNSVSAAKARRLGFTADNSIHDVIQTYITDELNGDFAS